MKIKFISNLNNLENECILPTSCKKGIPEWFTKTSKLIDGYEDYRLDGFGSNYTVSTIKQCSPFLDSLISGYFIYLDADVNFIFDENDNVNMRWRIERTLIDNSDMQQHKLLPKPYEGHKEPFTYKWRNFWTIKTPKGYSCLFTHPLNRYDLPFITYSGIVDTDKYEIPVQFPFSVLKSEEKSFILKKGTPLVQIIPFKRDDWNLEFEKFNENEVSKNNYNFFSTIKTAYKTNFWTRKHYE